MANFGPENTTLPQLNSAQTPASGVVERPAFLEGAADIFDQATGFLKQHKEAKGNAALGRFREQQLSIIQAVDQGKYNSKFARTKLRANLISMVNNFPGLADDIMKTNGQILGAAGMGSIVIDGTKEEIREEKRRDQLVKDGYVSANASDAQFAAADEALRVSQEAERRLKVEMDTIALERAKVGNDTAKLELLDKRQQKAAENALADMSTHSLNQLSTSFDRIVGDPNISQADKVKLIEQQWIAFEAEVGQLEAHVSPHFAASMKKVYSQRYDLAKKMAGGEIDDAAVKAEIERIENYNRLMLLRDPDIAAAAAVSKIFPELPSVALQRADNAVAKFFKDNSTTQGTPANIVDEGNRQATKNYLKALDFVDESDPEQAAEKTTHIQNILRSVELTEGYLKDNPKGAIELVSWLSGSSFLKAIKQNPEAFGNLEAAKEVIQRHYADEVWGLVRSEFKENRVVNTTGDLSFGMMGGSQDTTQIQSDQLTPDVVTYRATPEGVQFFPVDNDNAAAVARAKELNRNLKPVINMTIKAMTHLTGSDDYSGMFSQLDEMVLGESATRDSTSVQPAGGDQGDDLVMDDFLQGIEAEPVLNREEVSDLRGNYRLKGGGKMPKVKGMIIHHTGGRGDVDHVANVLLERGLSVQYIIDREGVVHQLMEDDDIAWHAGKNNKTEFNNKSAVGVEIIAKDDADVQPNQVQAARRLIKTLSERHGFDPMTNVFGHGEVATHKRPTEGMKVLSSIRG